MKSLILAVSFCMIPEILAFNLLNLSKTQEEILQDLSWRLKPTILKSFLSNETSDRFQKIMNFLEGGDKVGPNFRANDNSEHKGLLAQLSEQVESDSKAKSKPTVHRTNIDCDKSKLNGPKEEIAMKTRMFSLMYETVRDTDAKVKRAELIKDYYANNTEFEIGYLMGDATDKYNSMTEVASTVKRLYKEWKPLDHINAYEQISNLAIEINSVVDMILNKYNAHSQEKPETPDAAIDAASDARQHFKINKY